MKKIILLALLCCQVIFALAQDREFKKGSRLYNEMSYAAAIPLLERSYQKGNTAALELLAMSSVKSKNYEKAREYLKILAYDRNANPVYYKEYGKVLKNFGQYDEARTWFKQYIRTNPTDAEIRVLLKSCDMVPELQENPLGYGLKLWSQNSVENDFSPVLYKNMLVYSSSRGSVENENLYKWDMEPYLQLFQSQKDTGGKYGAPQPFPGLTSNVHDGPAVFTSAGNEVFFTRNNFRMGRRLKDNKGITRLKLYYSKMVNGKWSDPVEMPFNSSEYSVGHPAISRDGNTLYFVSDMPGSTGGTDIYYATRNGNEWSSPVNLGQRINTTGNEMFPTIHNDTALYFSSDYHAGLGGLDIFRAIKRGTNWVNLINIGVPFNSSRDDFGVVFNEAGNIGYLSSNRPGGIGGDDIFEFKKITIGLKLMVMDSVTYQLLPNTLVRLSDGRVTTSEYMTNEQGEVQLPVLPDKEYLFTTENKGYSPKKIKVITRGILYDKDTSVLIELVKGNGFTFDGLVVNDENDSIIPGALVKITNPRNSQKELGTTDNDGKFDFQLEAQKKYDLEVYKDNFLVHKEEFTTPASSSTKKIRLRPISFTKPIKLQNIYYDLDKAVIRPDAAMILDTLVKIMKDNPYLQIELGSHTDSRASEGYNAELSQKRAKSAIDYIVSKGVDSYRMVYKYYGETQLITPCPDGVDCPEEMHQLNRRTEFKIIAY